MFNCVEDVKEYINEKVSEHLSNKWVRVEYSNRMRRTLGTCAENRMTGQFILTFNNNFIKSNLSNSELIKNTVLHEIAHALAGGLHHHDSYWQYICRSIGGDGDRLARGVVKSKTYIYKCPKCGKVIERGGKMRKAWACKTCCDTYNNSKYSDDYKFEYIGIKEQ